MTFFQPDTVECNGEIFKPYISRKRIEERLTELGEEIDNNFDGKKPIFIGVLNGAFIFMADLMRQVSIPCEADFLKLSSYGDAKVSSGEVTERKQVDAQIKGRHVILVEDIVDTGLSMKYLLSKLEQKEPASISTVTLLHKKEATKHDVQLDFVGFVIPNRFVLGYGLDFAQEGRNLAQIYIVEEESE